MRSKHIRNVALPATFACALALCLFVVRAEPKPSSPPIAFETQDHRHPMKVRGDAGKEHEINTPEEWAARRASILAGFQDVAGKLPDRGKLPPIDVKNVGPATSGDGFAKQAISYVSDGNGRVPADIYVPTDHEAGKKMPAIVALQQTSAAGRADLGGAGKPNMAYAPELAKRGYVVICPDYPSFGELKDFDFKKAAYPSGTMQGIVNHMRAVDVLLARDEVDPERIGTIGHSLGGHNAIFLGVCDERVKVVVSSCGWTPFHDYYSGNLKGWCQDRYMPRIRDVYGMNPDKVPFDFPELIAAIAPRAFMSMSPIGDKNFEVDGIRRGIAAAEPIYTLLGAKDKLQVRYPDVDHDFTPAMRGEAFSFVDKVLGNTPKHKGIEDEDFAAELPRIPPHEPKDALSTFKTIAGFHMELAASEPNVASPVAISFDENGRMFICEMRDYSEQDKERLGTIRMLEDADGDGVYEKATVYASDLSWPTALIAYNGGLFVAAAPEIYWLKDSNGDGKADERKVVFTGFGRSNVQGLINSFNWGLDNRIHGATSSSGAKVTHPGEPAEKAVNLSGRDFSFDPRTLEMRAESGGAQHGMSFDDWGRKFVSSNSDHIQMVMLDDRYLARNPVLSVGSPRESIAADGPQAEVYRISPVEPWRIVRTRLRVTGAVPGIVEGGGRAAGYFTGATGVTIYRGDAYGKDYIGQAFVGDVGSNIVHRKVLKPNGVGFVANRVDEGKEFVASTDTWFRPAQFANAPDGCLYIIDVYREVIEHPASLPPMIKKHLDLTSGRDRGRIWRAAPDGFKERAAPKLGAASTADLVASLENRNGWTRDAAQRLIYERQDKAAAAPLLEKLVKASQLPEARMHALYALSGLGALTEPYVVLGLQDPDARVRENAAMLAEPFAKTSGALRRDLIKMVGDKEPRASYRAALALTAASPIANEQERAALADALLAVLKTGGADKWMRDAALLASADVSAPLLAKLSADKAFSEGPDGSAVIAQLARQVGARNQGPEVAAVLRAIAADDHGSGPLLAGLSDGLRAAGASLHDRVQNDPEARKALETVLNNARQTAGDASAKPAKRIGAMQLLPMGSFAQNKALLGTLIGNGQSQEIQLAALGALDRFADPEVGAMLTAAWPGMTPALRSAAANVIFARPERTAAFLDAVDAGKIKPADVDRTRLKALAEGEDAKLKARAEKLLASGGNAARQQVFEQYRSALSLKGDPAKGKATFQKTCAQCHRLERFGNEIGPNLSAMQARGAEAILLNVIDPNREVNPQYVDYVVQTKQGRTTSGLLSSETAAGITLKRAGGETETIQRTDIKRMRSSGLSIMPEGLEQGIDQPAMADLIAYIMVSK